MAKREEYYKAVAEFHKYFETEINALDKSTEPDDSADKKTVEELYNDLRNFVKNRPHFYIYKNDDKEVGCTDIEISCYFRGIYPNMRFRLYKKKNEELSPSKDVMYIRLKSFFVQYDFFIHINIDNRLNFVYHYLDWLVQHSEQFNQLKELDKGAKEEYWQKKIEYENERIKQKRIEKLKIKSAEEWVQNIMKDSEHPYMIDKSKNNQLILNVNINNESQLEIPVYYESFQEIIPLIPETIKQYENIIKESKIKTPVNNLSPNKK